VIAALTGAVVGFLVAGFEKLTAEVLLEGVLGLPLWAAAIAPLVGLLLSAAALHWMGPRTTPSTTDEYIRNFHDPGRRLDLRPAPARLLSSIVTLGFGGALGYEGPAMYLGATTGSAIQRRLARFFSPEQSKVLLVAGAAAGVAAIFKAPVTGLVFALEVPYQDDLARGMLLPAAMSAAASYVAFAAVAGTVPLLPVGGSPPFDFVDLGGAALIGLAAGVLSRVFVWLVARAKQWHAPSGVRAVAGGVVLAGLFLGGHAVTGENLTLGPGYDALRWALDPGRSVWLIAFLGTLRVAATVATIGGGGTGGLFFPLVMQGAILGRAAGGLVGATDSTLFPVVGIAAFLGAGYRVPLAAVVFVAEFTGRPGYIVPGLVAAVVAQLVAGRQSLSPYQMRGRLGHLERRLTMPVSSIVDAETRTVPPDATIEELFWRHLVGNKQTSVAVVDGDAFVGIATAEAVAAFDRDAWATTPVTALMRTDVTVAPPSWTLRDALQAMERDGTDLLPVCDGEGGFVGVVRSEDLVRLDEVLRLTQDPGA
jgi:CIC family chloride channel protein